jgi:hypothetical protein
MLPVVNLGIFLKENRQHWVGKYDRKIGKTGSKQYGSMTFWNCFSILLIWIHFLVHILVMYNIGIVKKVRILDCSNKVDVPQLSKSSMSTSHTERTTQ